MFEKLKERALKKPLFWGAIGVIVVIAIIVEFAK
jgi:hypothetical protein